MCGGASPRRKSVIFSVQRRGEAPPHIRRQSRTHAAVAQSLSTRDYQAGLQWDHGFFDFVSITPRRTPLAELAIRSSRRRRRVSSFLAVMTHNVQTLRMEGGSV